MFPGKVRRITPSGIGEVQSELPLPVRPGSPGEPPLEAGMKFAKIVFWVAGIWGLLVLTPLYFMFGLIGRNDPPPITQDSFMDSWESLCRGRWPSSSSPRTPFAIGL
jgi:hypothetical protein